MNELAIGRRKRRFADALRAAYVRDPCHVLPNALWKTRSEIESCEVFTKGPSESPAELLMWDRDRLLVAWEEAGGTPGRLHDLVRTVRLALIPGSMVSAVDTSAFTEREAYVRLTHRLLGAGERSVPPGDCVAEVRMPEEAEAVSAFIGRCYERMRPTSDEVRAWSARGVYEPLLWIWVRRGRKKRPVALGIAELDRSVGEVSLEWIQVAPEHRRQRLGSFVVAELLARACDLGELATVSGQAGSAAEKLYRSCGFEGDAIWWCLRGSTSGFGPSKKGDG